MTTEHAEPICRVGARLADEGCRQACACQLVRCPRSSFADLALLYLTPTRIRKGRLVKYDPFSG